MIFIHSSFRTSSTYIWSRFRREDSTIAYYEIFHEILQGISIESINKLNPSGWNSKHPVSAPYFLEYLPLLREEGGVVGFDPSFNNERFIPPDGAGGAISDLEANYVRGLVDHAENRGKIPVLTDTRSLGRLVGLKAAVPGMHVLLYRNLFQQWCSYTEQAFCGNPFFINTVSDISRLNAHDPVIRNIATLFPVETASERDVNTFYAFILIHVYLYAHAASAADLILDVNRLAVDEAYRHDTEHAFAGQNLALDFSDVRQDIAYSLVDLPPRTELFEQITIIGRSIIDTVPSEIGRGFAARVMSDLLDACERNEFHARALRSVANRSIADHAAAVSARDETERAFEALRADRETVMAAADAARREHDAVRADRDAAVSARDETQRACEALRADHDGALAAADAARREHDAVRADRDAAVSARDETQRACEALRADHDGALAAVEAIRRECAASQADRDAAVSARDETQRACESLRADRDGALAAADAARRERDGFRAERDAAVSARDEAQGACRQAEARQAAILRWSVAYHDSTAASLSWRLTRPLRWLGIGRPLRPPKPDFFDV